MKCQRRHTFLENQIDFFELFLLYKTFSSKPKDFLFAITNDREKQKILTFKKLEPANV